MKSKSSTKSGPGRAHKEGVKSPPKGRLAKRRSAQEQAEKEKELAN